MKKDLDTFSTEELGRLFPVILTKSNPYWKEFKNKPYF